MHPAEQQMAEAALHLRPAGLADAPALARVHVAAWRETYPGLLAPEILAGLSVVRRQQMWTRALEHPRAEISIQVLEDRQEDELVGFVNAGPERGMLPNFEGELYGLYLLQGYQGLGLGRSMFMAAARHLAGAGFQSMMCWVLDSNPTRGFYEHLGGRLAGEQRVEFHDLPYREVAYGWDDLAALLAA